MVTNFEILEEKIGDTVILRVKGELDALVAPQLKDKLIKLTENGVKKIIIDFKELVHINSLAMGILRGRLKEIREKDGDLKLVNLNTHISTIFEMVGLDELFDIYNNENEALESF
ncbi:anti-sigma B factor antagonist [Hypnocyclicus thermotrophus]|uniref:Anti-sigma factor antagonist n=1 Tax=Hypnocyclicus thermotrophus TaxID=1627895 RepID=A0AA46I5D6_9FUSO|nr:STAS domain-containing protein [Hypnocyclicus thermotrophus]TDT69169.1 anti-sigma B factor antagonist [Hypnocyclicus thermotrophus]